MKMFCVMICVFLCWVIGCRDSICLVSKASTKNDDLNCMSFLVCEGVVACMSHLMTLIVDGNLEGWECELRVHECQARLDQCLLYGFALILSCWMNLQIYQYMK